MFVRPSAQDATRGSSVTPDSVSRNADGNGISDGSHVADNNAAPNPHFVSNGLVIDPGRISLYFSFGYIAGLAVRTGVPLPLAHLSPKWWTLVANHDDGCSSVDQYAAVGACNAPGAKNKSVEGTRSRSGRPEVVGCDAAKHLPPSSAVEEVLTKLGTLEEIVTKKGEVDELLADARFVAPLSNGEVAELLPGGEDMGKR